MTHLAVRTTSPREIGAADLRKAGAAGLALALLAALVLAATASAAPARLTIRGAGWGHGVGMSQYGAKGFAEHGAGYRDILGHYYTGTAIGGLEPGSAVRVLLRSTSGSAAFSGATQAGERRLSPGRTYRVGRRDGASVWLLSARGRRLAAFTAPLVVRADAPIALGGAGAYRGSLEFRPGPQGVDVVNAVGLEDYLRGVVPAESPASWPLEALKAQAVAARSYAVTTSKDGAGFDQYADTRSQVYGGVAAEQPRTDAAVRATAGEVVIYDADPVTTYFFSTSGGRTEDVENTSLGDRPLPWLKSVDDPYESAPRHRWGPVRMSLDEAGRRLGSLVEGRFRGIRVVRRGASPRIVEADVIGTRGRTRVSGATLRDRLDLNDTWAYFTTTSSPPATPQPQAADARVGAYGVQVGRR